MGYDNLLIDGKNMAYRALYASKSSLKYGTEVHPIVVALRTMINVRSRFQPKRIHIFWDVRKESLWRIGIYPKYKEGREELRNKEGDVEREIKEIQDILACMFRYMKCTQYAKKFNEADDLIYAFAKINQKDCKNIVVTSDNDSDQLLFKFDNIDVFSPLVKKIKDKPKYDPIIIKSLSGDDSDNINNYRKVGEKTAQKYIDENKLDDFLNQHGRELYELNRKLIDWDLNPYLNDNIEYIKSVKINDDFDLDKIKLIIGHYKLRGMLSEIGELVLPFR